MAQALSEEERLRAARLRSGRERSRYVAAHSALRAILARYLSTEARLLRFRHGPHGKPELEGERATRFNLSHSGRVALCAVARGADLGVDVQQRPAPPAWEEVAESFFAAAELAAIRGLPAASRPEGFLACWVRKEACLKARGVGLTAGLAQVEVPVAPELLSGFVITEGNPGGTCWLMRDLWPGEGYRAAVAAQGSPWRLKCWEWAWPGEGDEGGGHT
jgi:4'-phosphopantetheinyl transferase